MGRSTDEPPLLSLSLLSLPFAVPVAPRSGSFMHRPGSRTNTRGCPRVAGRESGCASFVAVNTGMGGSTGTGACVMACGTNSAGGLT